MLAEFVLSLTRAVLCARVDSDIEEFKAQQQNWLFNGEK